MSEWVSESEFERVERRRRRRLQPPLTAFNRRRRPELGDERKNSFVRWIFFPSRVCSWVGLREREREHTILSHNALHNSRQGTKLRRRIPVGRLTTTSSPFSTPIFANNCPPLRKSKERIESELFAFAAVALLQLQQLLQQLLLLLRYLSPVLHTHTHIVTPVRTYTRESTALKGVFTGTFVASN